MLLLLALLQQLLAGRNDLLAVVFAQMADVGLGRWGAEQVRQPLVGGILGHKPGQIELVKIQVRGSTQISQFLIGQTPHGDLGALVGPNVGVALGILGADIEHGIQVIGFVDALRAAVDHRRTAVGAAHPAGLESFLFGFMIHGRNLHSLKYSKPAGRHTNHDIDGGSVLPTGVMFCCLPAGMERSTIVDQLNAQGP